MVGVSPVASLLLASHACFLVYELRQRGGGGVGVGFGEVQEDLAMSCLRRAPSFTPRQTASPHGDVRRVRSRRRPCLSR